MSYRHFFSIRSLVIIIVWLAFQPTANANVPDSVYLFSYNAAPTEGLSFAFSANGSTWKPVANGASFVKSDFAQWGANKKMYTPELTYTDGIWHLVFGVGKGTLQYAHTTSHDLIHWHPQDYPMANSLEELQQKFDGILSRYTNVVINNKQYQGTLNRVPYELIQSLEYFKAAENRAAELNRETLADDNRRFASIVDTTIHATLHIDANQTKQISDKLIGIFFEDINYSADGGLYAELVQNRDFEYSNDDHPREANWNASHSWTISGDGTAMSIDTNAPIHPNQKHYAVLNVASPGAALVNSGFDGIPVRKGHRYNISLFARQLSGKASRIKIEIRNGDKVLGTTYLSAPKTEWKQISSTITVKEDAEKATLALTPMSAGTLAVDFISLFPQQTFKNRKNGMRNDLAHALADLHPRFMRFPGGCLVHGDGIENMYHWKETIGPLHHRKPLRNIWGYHQTRGLGYFEYFQFCEDLGCEPLPVVAAAVPCQNSAIDAKRGGGQQNGIPFGPEFEQYKQDILDLIEWANGDPKTSKWARMRADAGHPKPFNLKYIGIGNEDLISDTFAVRYLPLIQAVKAKYPEITICGTVGPFYNGSDYDQGWRLAKDHKIDMVDEHYYVSPGWYINNQDYYDFYDRSASKVYLGEYASHGAGRRSTIETALTCAMHICSLERNGDIVAMSSYAPLLAKHGHTQWNPDLIYFDNQHVYPTVDYHVQKMCGQSQGDTYVHSSLIPKEDRSLGLNQESLSRRLVASTVVDKKTGQTYIKLINLLPSSVCINLEAGALQIPQQVKATQLYGQWNSTTAESTTISSVDLSKGQLTVPPYSFTILNF